jgi:hypothetical protein
VTLAEFADRVEAMRTLQRRWFTDPTARTPALLGGCKKAEAAVDEAIAEVRDSSRPRQGQLFGGREPDGAEDYE